MRYRLCFDHCLEVERSCATFGFVCMHHVFKSDVLNYSKPGMGRHHDKMSSCCILDQLQEPDSMQKSNLEVTRDCPSTQVAHERDRVNVSGCYQGEICMTESGLQ